MSMHTILPNADYYNTTRAYFFCVLGLVLFDGLVQIPGVMVGLVTKGRPYVIRRSYPHWKISVFCHKLLNLPLPMPWFLTNHHVADLARFLGFIGLNVFWGWNSFEFITDYDLYGWLTIANGALALLFGARNNLFATVVRVPSSILLMYHRWTGLAAVVHATIHFSNVSSPWLTTSSLGYVMESQRNQVGIMAWCSLSLIALTSIGIIRRKQFEVFYYSHFLFIAFTIGAIIHASHGLEFMLPGLILWGIDRAVRFYYNFRRVEVTDVTPYDEDVVKIKIRGAHAPRPSMVAWIQVRDVSFWNWHPFTVSSPAGSKEILLAFRGLGGYTRKVQQSISSSYGFQGESLGPQSLSIRLDGPYGVGHFQNTVYPLTVLIAGGIGITPAIGIATHIMRQAELSRGETTEIHIHLVWIVKKRAHLNWFAAELRSMVQSADKPSVQVALDMALYVTGESERGEKNLTDASEESDSPGSTATGRPDILGIVQGLQRKYPDSDAVINVCGPRSLVKTVRMAAVRASTPESLVYVDEESFEF